MACRSCQKNREAPQVWSLQLPTGVTYRYRTQTEAEADKARFGGKIAGPSQTASAQPR